MNSPPDLSPLAVVVLAAGLGTRMKSARPKVLHEVAGQPMLRHVLDSLQALRPEPVVVVVGPDMAAVAEVAAPHPTVVQEQRLGTGHAVAAARAALEGFLEGPGDLLVVYGDTPLLTPETLQRLRAARAGPDAPTLAGLAFRPADPARYGRVLLDAEGAVEGIIEFTDADDAQRAIDLCNGGILLGDARRLFQLIDALDNRNAKGEYYLTDVYRGARARGWRAVMVEADPDEVLGVDSRAQLAVAEAIMQRRLRARALDAGVTLVDPDSVWLAADTRLGRDVVIQPHVVFGPGVTVGDGVEIRAFSHIEGAEIAAGAVVGPFARLRPGARLGPGSHVGNFVEVKNASLGAGAKANHLTYLGDAEIGAGANVGAGTITCNYDGFAKHRTVIGAHAFIGSNTALVAPVTVGAGAVVGAGSTVSADVPPDALAVARAPQRNIEGAAASYRERREAAKKTGPSGADGRKQAAAGTAAAKGS